MRNLLATTAPGGPSAVFNTGRPCHRVPCVLMKKHGTVLCWRRLLSLTLAPLHVEARCFVVYLCIVVSLPLPRAPWHHSLLPEPRVL